MSVFWWPFLAALVTSFCLTPAAVALAKRLRLVDDPRLRQHPARTHRGIVPRAGGLALLGGVIIPALALLPLNKALIGILTAAILTVLIGLWDDRRDLSPYFRFLANIATAVVVVASGIGIPFITNPLGGVIRLDSWRIGFEFFGTHSILVWADLLAIIWIVWTMNIVGWSSGIDGQMPGFVGVTALVLGVMALRFSAHDISQTTVASLAFITAGAFWGFLPWNFYPQKIMPGYGGKTLAGLLIATIAILSGGKIGSALIVLAVPMLDAVYLLIRRIAAKKSPFRPDRHHLHHRLLALGWGKRRIALAYWIVSAILGLLTLSMSSSQKLFTFLALAVTIGGIVVWLAFFLQPKRQADKA